MLTAGLSLGRWRDPFTAGAESLTDQLSAPRPAFLTSRFPFNVPTSSLYTTSFCAAAFRVNTAATRPPHLAAYLQTLPLAKTAPDILKTTHFLGGERGRVLKTTHATGVYGHPHVSLHIKLTYDLEKRCCFISGPSRDRLTPGFFGQSPH